MHDEKGVYELLVARVPGVFQAGQSYQACNACGNDEANIALSVPSDPLDYSSIPRSQAPYTQCAACATLTIAQVPDDLSRYYDGSYYSHRGNVGQGLRSRLHAMRDAGLVFGKFGPSALLAHVWPYIRLRQLRPLIEGRMGPPLTRSSAILDVGCGSGDWLRRLAAIGFRNLTGCDPYMDADVTEAGLLLLKSDIRSVEGLFDLIVISHTLEHVEDPQADMAELSARLAPGGILMVRIPILNRFAWLKYGGYWVQLDAPRHMTLFSRPGFEKLATNVGLQVLDTTFDASEFMVLGSNAREQGLYPHGPRDRWNDAIRAMGFDEKKSARKIAARTNADETSDQATFYLRRAG